MARTLLDALPWRASHPSFTQCLRYRSRSAARAPSARAPLEAAVSPPAPVVTMAQVAHDRSCRIRVAARRATAPKAAAEIPASASATGPEFVEHRARPSRRATPRRIRASVVRAPIAREGNAFSSRRSRSSVRRPPASIPEMCAAPTSAARIRIARVAFARPRATGQAACACRQRAPVMTTAARSPAECARSSISAAANPWPAERPGAMHGSRACTRATAVNRTTTAASASIAACAIARSAARAAHERLGRSGTRELGEAPTHFAQSLLVAPSASPPPAARGNARDRALGAATRVPGAAGARPWVRR